MMDDQGSKKLYPFADRRITKYVSAQIDLLRKEKSQKQMAVELGYESANMISMFKRGETRIPLEKIPAFAKVLHIDMRHLFRLAMEDYWPGQRNALQEIIGTAVSDNEFAIIEEIRRLTNNQDLPLTSGLKRRLKIAFTEQG